MTDNQLAIAFIPAAIWIIFMIYASKQYNKNKGKEEKPLLRNELQKKYFRKQLEPNHHKALSRFYLHLFLSLFLLAIAQLVVMTMLFI